MHLCPLVGQDKRGALLWSPSLLLTAAIDSHLLLIGADSSSGVRKEEARFPRPRCPMQAQAQQDPALLSARIQACWGPLVQLPWQNWAGKWMEGAQGHPALLEGAQRAVPITSDSSLQHF